MKKIDKTKEELFHELESLKKNYNLLKKDFDSLEALYNKDAIERKRVEAEVKDSEERFRMIFENTSDGISIYTEDSDPTKRRLVECNERYSFMAGRSREELLQLGSTLGLQMTLKNNANDNRLESLVSGKSYQGTFSWIRPDGRENYIEYVGMPIKWRGQSYSIGIDRDITERKKHEEAIEKEHSLLRTLIDNLPNSVFIKDENYKKVLVNPMHVESVDLSVSRLGINPMADILGKTDFDIYPKEIAEEYLIDDRKVIQDGITILNKEEFGVDKYGEHRWFLISKIPLKDKNGSIKGMVGITTDITDQKRTEAALRESEEKYRLIFEHSPMGLLSFDENGVIVACNANFVKIIGSSYEKLIGLKLLTLPDSKIVAAVQKVINGHLGLYEDNYSSTTANKITPLRGLFAPMNVEGKGILGGVGIIEDITERKKNEEEIIKTNNELKRINSVKDKFFSIIAHDLKSPFQGLVGMTGMMAEDIYSFSQSELSDFSIKMHKNVKNLLNLLTNLLDWARMQQGTISFDPIEIILFKIVTQYVNVISKSGEQKDIGIILDIPQNHVVYADKEMLNSILGNLLSNAMKFTPRGGKITVSSNEAENNMIEIAVKDTGVGMSESLSEKLFKMEEQIGRRGTEGEESTGLGLLLCKEFVEKHGGKIRVKTKENEGSVFYFTLPKFTLEQG
jgi:PAS domain S-box-containing protein